MSTEVGEQAAKRGRPRSERAEAAIRAATNELLDEVGWAELTVDQIATRAEVSKATIYRWWPNKAAVAIDAFLVEFDERADDHPDTGSAREDLRIQLASVVDIFGSKFGRTILAIIAESQSDEALAEEFRARFIRPRRALATELLKRGVERGQLRSDLDPEIAIDALYAPLYFRMLIGHGPGDREFVDRLVDYVFDGISSRA